MEPLLIAIDKFIKDQGVATFFAIAIAIFTGTVVWGMSTKIDQHVVNDIESIRLLRVICESVAKTEDWRRACVDARYDSDKLVFRATPDKNTVGLR